MYVNAGDGDQGLEQLALIVEQSHTASSCSMLQVSGASRGCGSEFFPQSFPELLKGCTMYEGEALKYERVEVEVALL
jgi:hypothetical protein